MLCYVVDPLEPGVLNEVLFSRQIKNATLNLRGS